MQSNRVHEEETALAWRRTQAEHLGGISSRVAELQQQIATVRTQAGELRGERKRLLAEYDRLQETHGRRGASSYELVVQGNALFHEEIALAHRWVCLLQEQLTLQNEHHALLSAPTRSCLPPDE
jgi:hypothetical protein